MTEETNGKGEDNANKYLTPHRVGILTKVTIISFPIALALISAGVIGDLLVSPNGGATRPEYLSTIHQLARDTWNISMFLIVLTVILRRIGGYVIIPTDYIRRKIENR